MHAITTQSNEPDASFLPLASHDIESLTNAIHVASQTLSEMTNNPDIQYKTTMRSETLCSLSAAQV